MKYNSINGIILSKTLYKDSNVIFNVLTKEEGRVSLLAKGVRKIQSKLKGLLYIGSIHKIDIINSKGDLAIIRGAKNIFIPEIDDYEELKIFEKALQITSHFCQKDQYVQEIFFLLQEFIILFEKITNKPLLYTSYILKLLTELGFLGDLRYCIQCQEKLEEKDHYFNTKNGFICINCIEEKHFKKMSFESIKLIAFLQRSPFKDIDRLTIKNNISRELDEMINGIIKYNKEH